MFSSVPNWSNRVDDVLGYMSGLMADHNAELKNHAPKPTKTAKQNMKIALCVLSVQKRRDLKIIKATTVYHKKSQSQ
jgi:hypothetical protein